MAQKIKLLTLGIGLLTVMLTSCVESFDLPVRGADVRFLVVDGFLNTAKGDVMVNVQRASGISEDNLPAEINAAVMLEDSGNNSVALLEQDPGTYKVEGLTLDATKQYRLYIRTSEGKEYRSDFINFKPTPAIKEVSWKALSDGTQIMVDTEDATNETRYYRWTFEETWEYRARYASYCSLAVTPDSLVIWPRTPEQMIDICYRTQPSALIHTTTTAGLSKDRVNDFELMFLPKGTEKLGYGYSILVKQYAITKETYEYLERLKKTSQDLDGLYAPQPSQVKGNMFNITDPSEVVLGYFTAGEATEKRIFIKPQELPSHLRFIAPDASMICAIDSLLPTEDLTLYDRLKQFATSKNHLLVEALQQEFIIYGATYSTKECVDCRIKGGVTAKPVYWP